MKRIVLKVGTSTLTHALTGGPDRVYINSLASQIARERQLGREVILVSSGAVLAGMDRLHLTERPRTLPDKQAAASVGQGVLMGLYADIFANYGLSVGQVLLTRDDLRVRSRYLNARNTFEALFRFGTVPIVNENDTVAVDEIKVGDNDTLAAQVASLTDADGLIILSDIAGLYDKNPSVHADARLVDRVERVNRETIDMAGGAGTAGGTGGMRTKLSAARLCAASGIPTWIADGRRTDVIADCLAGVVGVGTYFAPRPKRPSARKRWLAWGAGEPKGTLFVNVCARRVLEEEGRSLLPVGVTGVDGDFLSGETVRLVEDTTGDEFGRGIARYGAAEAVKLSGVPTTQMAAILGVESLAHHELVHRDELALF